jgi:hypothetical protein
MHSHGYLVPLPGPIALARVRVQPRLGDLDQRRPRQLRVDEQAPVLVDLDGPREPVGVGPAAERL